MDQRTKTSILRLSSVFLGFILGNLDKIIGYRWIGDGVVAIIFQTLLYWFLLPISISLFFGFNSIKKYVKIWMIFRSWIVNTILVVILIGFIALGASIDAGYRIKISECEKFNKELNNQKTCVFEIKNNRFNFLKILKSDG